MINRRHALHGLEKLEDTYGSVAFRMGLTVLFDWGQRTLADNEKVDSFINDIKRESEEREVSADSSGKMIIAPAFQCEVVRCAAALAEFSVWDVLAYVKKHVHVE